MKATNRIKMSPNEKSLREGIAIFDDHMLFAELAEHLRHDFCNRILHIKELDKNTAAYVSYEKEKRYFSLGHTWKGNIFLNEKFAQSPAEWAYTIAHCMMHLVFGHFDAEKMPGYEKISESGEKRWQVSCDIRLWNEACDIYITKFLEDIKFGKPIRYISLENYSGSTTDERSIYEFLRDSQHPAGEYRFGTASSHSLDMRGLEHPAAYDVAKNECNTYRAAFAQALANSVTKAVSFVGRYVSIGNEALTDAERAAKWFINHYPLLGGLAAGFKIIEDYNICSKNEISIAAVNVELAEIYVNPSAGLNDEELKFVLAHEYLHAGLNHYHRCQGRDRYLWNIACDYVINGWLYEMHIGEMPERGELYDEELHGKSAEEIYDSIVKEFRKYSKLSTLRGYGKGDMIGDNRGHTGTTSLDDFFRSALQNGLEYHNEFHRGYIPAGLVEEIRALVMPPIPWDVELGYWFDVHFTPLAKRRTYARPSRRQGSTPDIPRPRYVAADIPEYSRTFGVVVDTSGSMSARLIGYALGAIASYAAAKEVPYARVVFCDADAYDAGYLAPEDIAGRVAVKGRGGTILQPGIDLLMNAKDFPKDAPILVITDGYIENSMTIHREHAFLIPKGHHLPFRTKGKVFYFSSDVP